MAAFRRISRNKVFKFLFPVFLLFLFCEYGIYYIVVLQCDWPAQAAENSDHFENETLRAMFVADTHLLGPIRGHWWDKLRREWQMYRSFQTSIQLLAPEAVFFLGDIFDEGQWVESNEFDDYVNRFKSLFRVPEGTRSYVIVGNHDTGFHYVITPELKGRFESAFKAPPVRRIRLKQVNFVLINSMAMEGDGCYLCGPAEQKIRKIAGELECEESPSSGHCNKASGPDSKAKSYSQPIVLQHFPMYRESDALCTGDDSAPESEKRTAFRTRIDCLSKSSTEMLLTSLQPRLIMSGHTHHGCLYYHETRKSGLQSVHSVPEYSVPSFSWRNRNNPSFFLGRFTKDEFQLEKCRLPKETTVIRCYVLGAVFIVLYSIGFFQRRFISSIRRSLSRLIYSNRRWRD